MKYFKILCLGLLTIAFFSGCEEQYKGEAMEVGCYVEDYYSNSSYNYVRVYDDNSWTYRSSLAGETFEVGICYSQTNSKPDYNNGSRKYRSIVYSGYISELFYFSEMHLTSGKKYYVRGYIKHKTGGIYYSDVRSFTP